MGDTPNIKGATQCLDMLGVMSLLQSGRVNLGFLGAAEVDRFGNLNSTRGRSARQGLRGFPARAAPAILLLSLIVSLRYWSIRKRRLPERVSYITSPGNGDGQGLAVSCGSSAWRTIGGDHDQSCASVRRSMAKRIWRQFTRG